MGWQVQQFSLFLTLFLKIFSPCLETSKEGHFHGLYLRVQTYNFWFCKCRLVCVSVTTAHVWEPHSGRGVADIALSLLATHLLVSQDALDIQANSDRTKK